MHKQCMCDWHRNDLKWKEQKENEGERQGFEIPINSLYEIPKSRIMYPSWDLPRFFFET